MNFADSTNIHRKFGEAKWRDLLRAINRKFGQAKWRDLLCAPPANKTPPKTTTHFPAQPRDPVVYCPHTQSIVA